MIRRFTARARRTIELSRCEGIRWNHQYLGCEHLLLGLLETSDGVASTAFHQDDVVAAFSMKENGGSETVHPTSLRFGPATEERLARPASLAMMA